MKFLSSLPVDEILAGWWAKVVPAYKNAFFVVLVINLLAFGFQMTNLTIHHDDVWEFFIRDTILGYYVGRFGLGWLHYYMQSAHIMPFLQMAQGIIMMTAYGLLICWWWGVRKMIDVVLISSIICTFPYMAQMFTYNIAMATYPIAHFLAATAVVFSTRAKFSYVAVASILYVAAFSIYQSVIANAATLFLFWVLSQILFCEDRKEFSPRALVTSTIMVLLSVGAGSLIYFLAVSFMDIPFGSYQEADQAFKLKGAFNLSHAATEVIQGSRSFFFWPENYLPIYLKKIHLVLFFCAGIACLWLPKGIMLKFTAVLILLLSSLSPRVLQFLHPGGNYHNLTLTAYAISIAGYLMIVIRSGHVVVRNLAIVAGTYVISGYLIQCNWISTVDHLNTIAHYSTMTQILVRIKSFPADNLQPKAVIVVGNYKMPTDYPYKRATGVASEYIDMKANHLQFLARLMREDISFIPADNRRTPEALEYAATHSPWPDPTSVGLVEGLGVVLVLSNDHLRLAKDNSNISIQPPPPTLPTEKREPVSTPPTDGGVKGEN